MVNNKFKNIQTIGAIMIVLFGIQATGCFQKNSNAQKDTDSFRHRINSSEDENINQPKTEIYFDGLLWPGKDSIRITLADDTLYFNSKLAQFRIAFKKPGFQPPKYTLIFTKDDKTLSALGFKSMICFAILDERDRGQLYCYDLRAQSFIKDRQFKRDYLVSSSSEFIADLEKESIVVVCRGSLSSNSTKLQTVLLEYSIESGAFKLISETSVDGELWLNDTLTHQIAQRYHQLNGKIERMK